MDRRMRAPPHGLSQLAASFLACPRLGIPRVPLLRLTSSTFPWTGPPVQSIAFQRSSSRRIPITQIVKNRTAPSAANPGASYDRAEQSIIVSVRSSVKTRAKPGNGRRSEPESIAREWDHRQVISAPVVKRRVRHDPGRDLSLALTERGHWSRVSGSWRKGCIVRTRTAR
jgi:hypothetical protein